MRFPLPHPGSLRTPTRLLVAATAGAMLALGTLSTAVGPASAATTVPCTGNTTADGAALLAAVNAHADGDTISLAAGCTYELDTTGFDTLGDALTIEGNGATITRSTGAPDFGFFDVESGGDLTVTGATLSDGSGGDGGAIFTDGGSVTLVDSTFSGNSGVDGGALAFEGESGTEVVIGSTFTGNQASTNGGAVHNDVTLIVINSTFTGNTAPEGGAFFNNGGTSATFVNTTVSGNTTTSTGGAFENSGGTTTATNTIVAGNTGGNCGTETIVDGGYDLEDGTTCGFTDHAIDADPALGALQDNGGPTATMAIRVTSPAHDVANLATCEAATPSGAGGVDQRGDSRAPVGTETACDIGAFEVQPVSVPVTPLTPAAPAPLVVTPTFTG